MEKGRASAHTGKRESRRHQRSFGRDGGIPLCASEIVDVALGRTETLGQQHIPAEAL